MNEEETPLDPTTFSEAVHGLLTDLEAYGVCLVHVSARSLSCDADASEAVFKAVARFARINRLGPFGKEMLHQYLVSHIR